MPPVTAKIFQAIALSASPNLNQKSKTLCGAGPPAGTIFTRDALSSGPRARKGGNFVVSIGESQVFSPIKSFSANSSAFAVVHPGRAIQNHLLASRRPVR